MIKTQQLHYIFFVFILLITSCQHTTKNNFNKDSSDYFTNPILDLDAEPWVYFYDGYYYYTAGANDKIILRRTKDITDLKKTEAITVWRPNKEEYGYHLWGPQVCRIANKWYIYFAADDGNTDNHQIYVIENEEENPLDGTFTMKGRIITDEEENWAIHPHVFEHQNELYMTWSGWQTRRIEIETQCIYIAKMENPWTLSTNRVLISKPEYEWERQWINPDGSRTAYPILVNEAPHSFYTKNKDKLLIYYAASGSWTPYFCSGLLSADSNSNLLDPKSWSKSKEPVFNLSEKNGVCSVGSPVFFPSPDGTEFFYLYRARNYNGINSTSESSPRIERVEWDVQGFPILNPPIAIGLQIKKPSGIN